MRNKKTLFFISLILCFTKAFSQYKEIIALKEKNKDEDFAYISRGYKAQLGFEKDKLKITCVQSESFIYLTEKSTLSNSRNISSSDLMPVSEINTTQYNLDGTKFKTEKVRTPTLISQPGKESFYDDRKIYNLNFNNLKPLTYIESDYKTTYLEPRFFNMFYVDDYYNTESFNLEIVCDKKIKLCFEYYNTSVNDFEYSETEKGKNIIYTWKKKDLKKISLDKNNLNFKYYSGVIGARVCEINQNNKSHDYLKSPKDLYNWYYSITNETVNKQYPALKTIADSLTKNTTDTLEKMKNIFYYVQDNISYIAIEDGMGGFVPRSPELVNEKRMGDCKDMATLIYNLAKTQNLPCYLTWIGTRSIPYTYNENPTTYNDNHMIACFIYKGKYYFLDGTGKDSPFELHTSMIQGKEGLIGKGADNYEIKKVPIFEPQNNMLIDTLNLTIDNLNLKGNRKLSASGYEKLNFIYNTTYTKSKKEKFDYIHEFIVNGNNKTRYINSNITNPAKESHLIISEDIEINDYVTKTKAEYILNPILCKSVFNKLPGTDFKYDIEIDNKFTRHFTTILSLPNNNEFKHVPDNKNLNFDNFSYSITYKKEGNKLITDVYLTINTLVIKQNQKQDWKKFVQQFISDSSDAIIFTAN